MPSEAFQRAFVAMTYWLGRRGNELLDPLPNPDAAAVALAERLSHPERERRARELAVELAPVVRALEQRRLA